eukprot:9501353-Pyramimonas_sp.AAC.1
MEVCQFVDGHRAERAHADSRHCGRDHVRTLGRRQNPSTTVAAAPSSRHHLACKNCSSTSPSTSHY